MDWHHGMSLTATGSACGGRRPFRAWWRGLSLACAALSAVSCVAQQADLVKLDTEVKGKIARMDQEKAVLDSTLKEANQAISESRDVLDDLVLARARMNRELRKLDERNLHVETNLKQMNEALGRESALREKGLGQVSGRLDALAQQDADHAAQLRQLGAGLKAGLNTQHAGMLQTLDERNKTFEGHFADFRDSLVQFKASLVQLQGAIDRVDAQLTEERDRARGAEVALQQSFSRQQDILVGNQDVLTGNLAALTRNQDALREKLDLDTQALKDYLATNVQGAMQTTMQTTVDSITAALEASERALNDRLNAQGAQLSEVGMRLDNELAALRGADVRYGANMEEMSRSLTQLRDAVNGMAGTLGERSDGQTQRLDRLEQAQTEQASRAESVSTHLDVAIEGLHNIQQSLQGYVDRMNQIAGDVEALRDDVRDDRESRVNPSAGPPIELPTAAAPPS